MTATSPYLANPDSDLVGLGLGPFTLTTWFRSKQAAPDYVAAALCVTPALKLVLNTDGTLTLTAYTPPSGVEVTVSSALPVVAADWSFIAIAFDPAASTLTLTLNGVASSVSVAAIAASSLHNYSAEFQLGSTDRLDTSTTTAAFDLDEASIWGRVLTLSELATIYETGSGNAYPFFNGAFNMIFQGDVLGPITEPVLIASASTLWDVSPLFDSVAQRYQAEFTPLFSGAVASRGYSWVATNFNNKIIVAQHDNNALYWIPGATTAPALPGLPIGDAQWDGVISFYDHIVLWKDDRLKWSDIDNFYTFIPVAETAVSTSLTLANSFVQPAPGGNVSVTIVNPTAAVASISLTGSMAAGSVAVGSTGTLLLTIVNSGTTDLIVTGISMPPQFTGSYAGTIPVGGSVPVVITFTPPAPGSYDGAVTVASNATSGTSTIGISGTGIGLTKTITLSGTLNFGSCVSGKTLVSALTITNTGTDTVTVSSIVYPIGYTGAWSGTIAAGAQQIVAVTFSPTSASTYSGNITVTSDATGTNIIAVTGTGVTSLTATMFLTDNGTCQFGNVTTGSTPSGTLRIYNPSGASITIVGVTVPAGFSATYSGTIAAYSFNDVTVTFSPVSAIAYGGAISVAASGAVGGTPSLFISGTGTVAGAVIVLSGSLAFGDVPTIGTAQGLLTITNPGASALTVTSISYPTGFAGAYAGTVAPGASVSVVVTFAPTSAITYTGTLTVNTSGVVTGTNTLAVSGTGFDLPTPAPLVAGQFVSLIDIQGAQTYYNFYQVVSMTGTSLVLTLQDLTGVTPAGSVIAVSGHTFVTVDANEAGETQVTGSDMNGPIYKVTQNGDYAYIFKERSIQSMQYTGLGNGTFFIHRELVGEGLISRDALVNRNDGVLVFLGHKDLYTYQGGPNLNPVCRQTTKQLFTELDRARLDAIKLFHNENAHEIWVKYPVSGGFRVLIWNYIEDSATFDDYDALAEFTALGLMDWASDVVWEQVPGYDDLDEFGFTRLARLGSRRC